MKIYIIPVLTISAIFHLGILFIYYIKKGEDIFNVQTDMNLEIKRKFNENEIEMAFPTQTIYTKSA